MAAGVSDEFQRHVSALIVVQDIYPELMKEMISNTWPSSQVAKLLKGRIGQNLVGTFPSKQQEIVKSIDTDGYRRLDSELMYKIIRYFDLVDAPSRGWGNKPRLNDNNQGDDVERMRHFRNNVVHRPRLKLTENEYNELFAESIEIAKRLDTINGNPSNGFEKKIENIKYITLSFDTGNLYLANSAEIQCSMSLNNNRQIHLYLGDDIKHRIQNSESETESTPCVMYMRDPAMTDPLKVVKILEKAIQDINEGTCKIKLLAVKEGSLILHIVVSQFFTEMKCLYKELNLLFNSMFELDNVNTQCGLQIDVVLAESDYIIIEDQSADIEQGLSEPDIKPVEMLKISVVVPNSSFQSFQTLHGEVQGFIDRIVTNLDINAYSGNGSLINIAMIENNKERDRTKMLSSNVTYERNIQFKQKALIDTKDIQRQKISVKKKFSSLKTDSEFVSLRNKKDGKEDRQKGVLKPAYRSTSHKTNKEFTPALKISKGIQDPQFAQKFHACDKEKSVYWCHDCKRFICMACNNQHSVSKDTSHHTVQLRQESYALDCNFKVNERIGMIWDINVLHDGLLVIAVDKQLITFHITGKQQHTTSLPGEPCSVAIVDHNTVAVTLKNTVVIADVRQRQVIKNIAVQRVCYGIMYRDKHLLVGCIDRTIKIIDMSGKVTSTIPVCVIPYSLCGGKEGRIYYSDMDTLYCVNIEGTNVFTFTDSNIGGICGIAIDDNGYILVISRRSNNIFSIHPDGKKYQINNTQIPSNNTYEKPYICYDSLSKSVVAGRGNTVYVYKKV